MEGNLTKGPILKTLTKLAIPIMASSFLGTLYNITDMAWIGILGSKAVAGVGVGGMFTWLSQGLAAMSRMGGQVQVAQCIGRGDREKAHKYAQAAVQLATLMGLLFAAVMLLFLHPLVGFFQLQDPEALQAALSYTKIACGLIVFSFLTLTLTGIYTAQGDSKTPFVANFIGLVTNMILDPLLILGLGPVNKFGVNGAAIATVSAQAIVMSILILGVVIRKKENVLKGINLFAKIPFKYLKGICKIGIPTAIQGMVYCGISMVLTRMVSGFGAEAVAVQRVGGQIESVSWNTADGFGTALNAFIGQNYGAGKMDRVKKGYKASLCSIGIWGIFITMMFVFQPKAIAHIFFHEPKAIMIAIGYLVIIGLSEAFMSVELMTVGALSGLGKTHLCSVISILFTGARIPLAIVLSGTLLGLDGIWWALSVTSIVKGIQEKTDKYTGGIYHKTQIDLTYNSNHMEGSRLTHDQTRYIFKTNMIGVENEVLNVDDVIETANHFCCIDMIIDHAKMTLTEKFIINPKGTSISKLSKAKKSFTVKWKKQNTQTTGYRLIYSMNSKFKTGNKYVMITSNKTTSKSIKKLKAKKKYYIRICTYKTVGGTKYYSGWSSVKSVTTK